MSEKTQIILLAICLFINVCASMNMFLKIEQLEYNQEFMRNYINKKLGDKNK